MQHLMKFHSTSNFASLNMDGFNEKRTHFGELGRKINISTKNESKIWQKEINRYVIPFPALHPFPSFVCVFVMIMLNGLTFTQIRYPICYGKRPHDQQVKIFALCCSPARFLCFSFGFVDIYALFSLRWREILFCFQCSGVLPIAG